MKHTKHFTDACCMAHCSTCRKAITGLQFRIDISKAFLLPEDNVNFTCPHGMAWEEEYKVPFIQVDSITLEKLNMDRVPDMVELERMIEELGNPTYLLMHLTNTKTILSITDNCAGCTYRARCKDLYEKVMAFKAFEKTYQEPLVHA